MPTDPCEVLHQDSRRAVLEGLLNEQSRSLVERFLAELVLLGPALKRRNRQDLTTGFRDGVRVGLTAGAAVALAHALKEGETIQRERTGDAG